METYEVFFVRENRTVRVSAGETVLRAQIAAGLVPDAPCGGKGTCGKCAVLINGVGVLACQTPVTGDTQVYTCPEHTLHILRESGARTSPLPAPRWGETPEGVDRPLLAAVDLGSTSVVAYLLDGVTGEVLGVRSEMNPQRQYGGDVVARASLAMERGAELLSTCVRETVDGLLHALAEERGRSPQDIVRVVMAGNSCMHHLFLELPVDTLVLAPYEPKVKDSLRLKAGDYGLRVHPEAALIWLPNIGGFVGADTAACILAAEFDRREGPTLLVDIGTNGEMVLGGRDGFSACSTAAGPAFEGARITCGMRGGDGAIDKVWLEGDRLVWHVIGGGEPEGICGSGLLDAACCLLKLGLLDGSGRLEETYRFTDRVYLTQKDIRELQLAKAAIAAGVRILCKRRGLRTEDVKELLLAGAFGNYLRPESACAIGLLPQELLGKIRPVGNAAGEGACLAALREDELERCKTLARRAEFIELAMDPEFQDIYVDELSFEEEEP